MIFLYPIIDYLKELKMCLHELSVIDDDMLEALGALKEYQRLRNWIIRMIKIFFSCLLLSSIIYIITYELEKNFINCCLAFMSIYPEFVNFSSTLIWGTIIGYMSFKFHQVNDRLHVLYSDLFENDADDGRRNRSISVRQQITGVKDRKQYIWIIM
ncbi:hypothetical protein ALC57_04979 [Trachymyrmex cornetzi]|uniref:Uncharacterized protein n=1 Tax=Trachymyrmex cornetzi TaxID=471704 RepID=A0A151JBX6_9HYME|nr:hypothetical protein ALC57_04979 [Trachymyrmex cornetzi]